MKSSALVVFASALLMAGDVAGQGFERREDVVYGHKDGTALTMDVFRPKTRANGAGIIWVVSGGFVSSREGIRPGDMAELIGRGYTVFAVVHGSQPRYSILDAVADVDEATGYIRAHATGFGVDPDRLGITGASSGAHLALMQGVAGKARVGAVACFFPPTDFLNYGRPGSANLGTGELALLKPAFEFKDRDPKTGWLTPVTDPGRLRELARRVSPAQLAGKGAAPVLLLHGDADKLVPIQQSILMVAKLKQAGVPAELVVRRRSGHGWRNIRRDLGLIADWFDKHLAPRS